MKRGGIEHPKMEALSLSLNTPMASAVGHIEALAHFTAKYAPQGDIGKWPDSVIARRCLWDGDPELFITALISSGWAESHNTLRLVVHDWSEHADDAVQKALKKKRLTFWDGSEPYSRTVRDSGGNQSRVGRESVAPESRQPEPEPEPEPEPFLTPKHTPRRDDGLEAVSQQSISGVTVKGMAQLLREDMGGVQFEDIQAKMHEYGIKGGPDDWVLAKSMWSRREPALRQKIYDSLLERIRVEDSGYSASSPQKYIENHFMRAIKTRSAPLIKTAAASAKDDIWSNA